MLAWEMAEDFARQTIGERAWQVKLKGRDHIWGDNKRTFSVQPHSPILQRLQKWVVRMLRFDPQL